MRVLAINGSPRRGGSNTQRLLGPMLEAAAQEGAEVEHLYLRDLDVRPCTGCFSCWTQTPGRCVQEDDMAGLLDKLRAADAFVLGFGLYIFTAPAGVQAFLERLLPTLEPWLVQAGDSTGHPVREGAHRASWTVVCNCGFPEQLHFDALRAKFAHLGVQPVCMAAGEFLGHLTTAPELAEAWAGLKGALEGAGGELARAGALSDEVRARLDRPVIEWAGVTAQQYNEMANQSFGEALGTPGGPES
jgi:multimeric flavodoxin WrbA